jgi:hypothetical protein
MLTLVVDWSEVSGILQELIEVLLRVRVSPVSGWGQMLLSDGEESNVVLHPSENVAKNAIKTTWSLLNAHLWPSNGEIVSNFVFSKVAILDHASGKHASLTDTDQIEIALTKDRMLLNGFASLSSLRSHRFKNRIEVLLGSTNHHAFSMKCLPIGLSNSSNDSNEVINLAIVAVVIDSMVNQCWQCVVPLFDHRIGFQVFFNINLIEESLVGIEEVVFEVMLVEAGEWINGV